MIEPYFISFAPSRWRKTIYMVDRSFRLIDVIAIQEREDRIEKDRYVPEQTAFQSIYPEEPNLPYTIPTAFTYYEDMF